MTTPTHSQKRPQILLTRASIVSTIGGLIALLVTMGVLPAALGNQLTGDVEIVVGAVSTILAVVLPLVHALVSRGAVTPVSDPVNNAGEKLVPVGSQLALTTAIAPGLVQAFPDSSATSALPDLLAQADSIRPLPEVAVPAPDPAPTA
ncbi:MAG: hypothetical protein QOH56_2792 [Pseudonocardiales bacterium]|jgi:hypothetical protein|nr:hypothetical protein [Pseudonocardiales bacterium]